MMPALYFALRIEKLKYAKSLEHLYMHHQAEMNEYKMMYSEGGI